MDESDMYKVVDLSKVRRLELPERVASCVKSDKLDDCVFDFVMALTENPVVADTIVDLVETVCLDRDEETRGAVLLMLKELLVALRPIEPSSRS
jgi:hypothetical protein